MKKGGRGTWLGEDGNGGEEGGNAVGSTRQGIGLAIAGTLAIDDVVVIGNPSGMSSRCCPGLGEILQSLVISVDLDRMSCSLGRVLGMAATGCSPGQCPRRLLQS